VQVRAEDVVKSLQSSNLEERRKAARFIKNAIIGNKLKKKLYANLGVISSLVDILASDKDDYIIIQSAAALGSFAYDNVKLVNDSGATRLLLRTLTHSNPKVVETAACSLKIVFLSKHCPRSIMAEGDTSKLVVSLLGHPNENVNEVAAAIISRSCDEDNGERRDLYWHQGAMGPLLKLLYSKSSKTQEAGLEGVAALTCDISHVCTELITRDDGAHLDTIIKFVKDNRARMRLAAISVIANMCQTKTLPPQYQPLTKSLIPMIIRLLSEDPMSVDAPQILARLVGYNEELQIVATEAEAVPRLGSLLQSTSNERLKENILHALSVIASLREECRKQVVEHKLLAPMVASLSSVNPGIRAAACRCCRSLSRSVKHLRTSLVDAGVATPLFNLLDDPSLDVQIAASATLCNIVLDFSPMKKIVMEGGGIAKLVSLLHSMDPALRLNGLWGLKNLAYEAELPLKEAILNELTYDGMYALMFNEDAAIQEQTLYLLRNFLFEHADSIWSTESQLNDLIKALEKLFALQREKEHLEVLKQAIYVVCNLASPGIDMHKNAVIASTIPPHLLYYMDHKSAPVRVAAVWCAMNLSWADSANLAAAGVRVAKLRELGFDRQLAHMVDDPDLDVRDRVKTALQMMDRIVDEMKT
jgi:hypothetical protein